MRQSVAFADLLMTVLGMAAEGAPAVDMAAIYLFHFPSTHRNYKKAPAYHIFRSLARCVGRRGEAGRRGAAVLKAPLTLRDSTRPVRIEAWQASGRVLASVTVMGDG